MKETEGSASKPLQMWWKIQKCRGLKTLQIPEKVKRWKGSSSKTLAHRIIKKGKGRRMKHWIYRMEYTEVRLQRAQRDVPSWKPRRSAKKDLQKEGPHTIAAPASNDFWVSKDSVCGNRFLHSLGRCLWPPTPISPTGTLRNCWWKMNTSAFEANRFGHSLDKDVGSLIFSKLSREYKMHHDALS